MFGTVGSRKDSWGRSEDCDVRLRGSMLFAVAVQHFGVSVRSCDDHSSPAENGARELGFLEPVATFGLLIIDSALQSVTARSNRLVSNDIHAATFAGNMRPSCVLSSSVSGICSRFLGHAQFQRVG